MKSSNNASSKNIENMLSIPFDPTAPISTCQRSKPLAYMHDHRKAETPDLADRIKVAVTTENFMYPPPSVAIAIRDKLRDYGVTQANSRNIHDFLTDLEMESYVAYGEFNKRFDLILQKYSTRGVMQIYDDYISYLRNIYADKNNFLFEDDQIIPVPEVAYKLDLYKQQLYYYGMFHIPELEPMMGIVTNATNIMVFDPIKEGDDIGDKNEAWYAYCQQRGELHLNSKLSRYEQLYMNTPKAIHRMDQIRLCIADINALYFSKDIPDIGSLYNSYGQNILRYVKDTISIMMRNIDAYIGMHNRIMSNEIILLNQEELAISLINFIIDYANYYDKGEPDQLLPIYRPIAARVLIPFNVVKPAILEYNNKPLAELLNIGDNNKFSSREQMIAAIWDERMTVIPLIQSEYCQYLSPQIWYHAFYSGILVPSITGDGKMVKANHKYVNSTQCYMLKSALQSIPTGINNCKFYFSDTFLFKKRNKNYEYDECGYVVGFMAEL